MCLDAIRVKVKEEGKSRTKSVYRAQESVMRKKKRLGKRSFAQAVDRRKQRGVELLVRVLDEGVKRYVQSEVGDILIACMDGPTGFPEAVRAVFPHTVQ